MSPLDKQFGEVIAPRKNYAGIDVYAHERAHAPNSLTLLERSSAVRLSSMMQSVKSGFGVLGTLVFDVLVIWLVDADGQVRFAVEEMFYGGQRTERPKLQTFDLTRGTDKLGHPALLDQDKNARIAGEIYFDTGLSRPSWVINNNSGRYGRRVGRRYSQLVQVAEQFRKHDIELVVDFVG